MNNAKWSILILTQPTRQGFLAKLLIGLAPQVAANCGVELIIAGCDYTKSLGANRQLMRERASGEYISFVDDDDVVSHDYVQEILGKIATGVDYIGFKLQMYIDGVRTVPTFNSLVYKTWYHNRTGYYRDISHVCPVKRDLALQITMDGDFGEDRRWAEGMRQLGILKTEQVIDKTLYHYYYRQVKEDDVRTKR